MWSAGVFLNVSKIRGSHGSCAGDADEPDEAATADLVRALEAAGAACVAVHCRYAGDDPPKTPARQDETRSLFETLRNEHVAFRERCPLLANGDYYSPDAVATACSGDGRADGVLVARPALLDPSAIFRTDADRKAREDVLKEYLNLADRGRPAREPRSPSDYPRRRPRRCRPDPAPRGPWAHTIQRALPLDRRSSSARSLLGITGKRPRGVAAIRPAKTVRRISKAPPQATTRTTRTRNTS